MSNLYSVNNKLSASQLTQYLSTVQSFEVNKFPYTKDITRETPTAFIFLIDQSSSMGSNTVLNGESMSRAEAVAQIINKMFNELTVKCKRMEGGVPVTRDYVDLALIGYGSEVESCWSGNLQGRDWVKISDLEHNFLRKETITENKIVRGKSKPVSKEIAIWLEPKDDGLTPMKEAMTKAKELITQWSAKNPNSYPPIVFNITDGAATDAQDNELIELSKEIRQLKTTDGHVLFMNIHISGRQAASVTFPREKSELPQDKYAHLLFDMSSDMPQNYCTDIAQRRKDIDVFDDYTGMAYQADMSILIDMVEIGTRTNKALTQAK